MTGTTGTSKAASVAALTTAAGAVACGVCCVLPFASPVVAAAGVGGALAWLGRAHGVMTLIASAIYAMTIATAVLGLAMAWPRIEPYVIRVVRGR